MEGAAKEGQEAEEKGFTSIEDSLKAELSSLKSNESRRFFKYPLIMIEFYVFFIIQFLFLELFVSSCQNTSILFSTRFLPPRPFPFPSPSNDFFFLLFHLIIFILLCYSNIYGF